mmetsp:Transcript_13742/g.40118  ORF Transcript_13742/g.40118 Transcript_13742/m.40118 type:complete len:294 (-) Transcript_13742:266-1147(-)
MEGRRYSALVDEPIATKLLFSRRLGVVDDPNFAKLCFQPCGWPIVLVGVCLLSEPRKANDVLFGFSFPIKEADHRRKDADVEFLAEKWSLVRVDLQEQGFQVCLRQDGEVLVHDLATMKVVVVKVAHSAGGARDARKELVLYDLSQRAMALANVLHLCRVLRLELLHAEITNSQQLRVLRALEFIKQFIVRVHFLVPSFVLFVTVARLGEEVRPDLGLPLGICLICSVGCRLLLIPQCAPPVPLLRSRRRVRGPRRPVHRRIRSAMPTSVLLLELLRCLGHAVLHLLLHGLLH